MSRVTRRHLLKTGLAASAGAVTAQADFLPKVLGKQDLAADPAGSAAAFPEAGEKSFLRERLLLDFGWRFHLGNADVAEKDFGWGARLQESAFSKTGVFLPVAGPDFDDRGWKSVDLPHDWAVELPFTDAPKLIEHGSKPLGRGYPETSIGWYRRVFDLPASDAGRRIAVEFDGVFRNALVLFNDIYIGENFSGYAPARYDLTDFANYGGKNTLVVRVDATLAEGWFYEGAGIYRHVWLTKTDPLHVAPWGTFVRSEVQGDSATLLIDTEIENESDKERTCSILLEVIAPGGNVVASVRSKPGPIAASGKTTLQNKATVPTPALWSLERPNLYRLRTTLEGDGSPTDREETVFGIRTIDFDSNKGFLLNGEPVKIQGTCNHQDHAGVGTALPDRLQSYRIERLKEMESNGYRTSHNPPTPELLDACDRLGMLVMDETRMMSSSPEGLSQLDRLIRRDRNHPSVVIWSIGNEEPIQGTPRGKRVAESMKHLVRELDPTRPISEAMNGGWGKGLSSVVDVQGFNYAGGRGRDLAKVIDDYHQEFPAKPTVGTETGSTVSTRGIYANDKVRGYVSAYDLNYPPWASTAEQWWSVYGAREFLSGGFAWTGFDYRGEPTPYGWPCVSSHFGILDTCGFPKDNFYYYRAWWGAKPVLHLFPHWNWSGKEGQEISVWCHSNLDSVELFLNGTSLGSKEVKRFSHVEWKVKYAPGVIEARGTKDGRVALTTKRETIGASARLVVRADRRKISADGEDVSVITVEVVDAKGRTVPVAMNKITFKLSGPGRLIGVGNGDPSCHERDKPLAPDAAHRSAFNGLCMAIVQALKQPGEIRVEATSPGVEGASVTMQAAAARLRPAVA
jgi:beta-galactosidase